MTSINDVNVFNGEKRKCQYVAVEWFLGFILWILNFHQVDETHFSHGLTDICVVEINKKHNKTVKRVWSFAVDPLQESKMLKTTGFMTLAATLALTMGSGWAQTSDEIQAINARAKALELDTPYVPPPGEAIEHYASFKPAKIIVADRSK